MRPSFAAEPAPPACTPMRFEGDQFTVCAFDPQADDLRLVWTGRSGRALRSFAALAADLGPERRRVRFAMNAGMFDEAGAPIGLFVENAQERHAISTANGHGNFHLKPNGVFWIGADGAAHVETTEAYLAGARAPKWATQSGPMLVIDGELHPAIRPAGPSRYIRNGVGIDEAGNIFFAISEAPVSFGRFARLFRDQLKCRDALYFDGAVSSLWAPRQARRDSGAELGPMVVVLDRQAAR